MKFLAQSTNDQRKLDQLQRLQAGLPVDPDELKAAGIAIGPRARKRMNLDASYGRRSASAEKTSSRSQSSGKSADPPAGSSMTVTSIILTGDEAEREKQRRSQQRSTRQHADAEEDTIEAVYGDALVAGGDEMDGSTEETKPHLRSGSSPDGEIRDIWGDALIS